MIKKTALGTYSLIVGMLITLKYAFKPAITIQYPQERRELPERSRWLHMMTGMVGENVGGPSGKEKDKSSKINCCIGCGRCRDVCPTACIEVSRIKLGHKEKIHYSLDLSKCMFCGFCVEICPTSCLKMTNNYELASYDKTKMVLTKEALLNGAER